MSFRVLDGARSGIGADPSEFFAQRRKTGVHFSRVRARDGPCIGILGPRRACGAISARYSQMARPSQIVRSPRFRTGTRPEGEWPDLFLLYPGCQPDVHLANGRLGYLGSQPRAKAPRGPGLVADECSESSSFMDSGPYPASSVLQPTPAAQAKRIDPAPTSVLPTRGSGDRARAWFGLVKTATSYCSEGAVNICMIGGPDQAWFPPPVSPISAGISPASRRTHAKFEKAEQRRNPDLRAGARRARREEREVGPAAFHPKACFSVAQAADLIFPPRAGTPRCRGRTAMPISPATDQAVEEIVPHLIGLHRHHK